MRGLTGARTAQCAAAAAVLKRRVNLLTGSREQKQAAGASGARLVREVWLLQFAVIRAYRCMRKSRSSEAAARIVTDSMGAKVSTYPIDGVFGMGCVPW